MDYERIDSEKNAFGEYSPLTEADNGDISGASVRNGRGIFGVEEDIGSEDWGSTATLLSGEGEGGEFCFSGDLVVVGLEISTYTSVVL